MLSNPYQKYQRTQVETASQGKLIVMLFDGAIKFCKIGIQGLEENDFELANTNIVKAQAIVNELMITLDVNAGGEIATNLYSLYEYMYRRLITANIKKDTKIIEEVLNMLIDMRGTWEQVIKLSRTGASKPKELNSEV